MKLKTVLLLTLLSVIMAYVQAIRPTVVPNRTGSLLHFDISLAYNADYERYEVYAQANFTGKRFILGPSQISLVVPKQVVDQPLAIYSATANWTDYSSVYAPLAAPAIDFHGINSMGKIIDFQENERFMLFTFSLKGGYIDGVRLYINGKDLRPGQPGMMGGDFANTMQDHTNNEFFHGTFNQMELAQLSAQALELGAPEVSVYPNPITGDVFSVTTARFNPGERLTLRLLSTSGVELFSAEAEASKLVNYQIQVPKQLSGQAYLYAERTVSTAGQRTFCKKLIIVN